MSARLFPDDVLFLQRFLSCCGCYAGALDGRYGTITAAAEQDFADQAEAVAAKSAKFDARSETNIRGLQLKAQPLVRRSLAALLAKGHEAKIISGTRTYAEQNVLYKQGRFGNSGPVVTNARGGYSWHNFGLAWDIGLFKGGTYLTDGAPYAAASPVAKVPGLEWGGDWKNFKDVPHYQLATGGGTVSAARSGFETGGRA
jgi:peptidoglycan L-alanyl-D-glutamate endopeptidase CwlK